MTLSVLDMDVERALPAAGQASGEHVILTRKPID